MFVSPDPCLGMSVFPPGSAPPPTPALRVLSGPTDPGVVRGSFVLVGGDPGIGKSTLMLQARQRVMQRQLLIYIP